jgi:DNA-binding MarR family transcriptional regulator
MDTPEYKPQQILQLVTRIHEEYAALIEAELARAGHQGLVSSHADILGWLLRRDRLPMTELARRINRRKNTVTVLVNKLEQLGYVRREDSLHDNRISLVCLTDHGREMLPAMNDIALRLLGRLWDGVEAGAQEQAVHTLSRVLENIRGLR